MAIQNYIPKPQPKSVNLQIASHFGMPYNSVAVFGIHKIVMVPAWFTFEHLLVTVVLTQKQ